ncbi:MAG TPA: hypothetical protein VK811_07400 [Candidatus Acidoferrum sp.]|jgi:hypothetical protein|nr:hypothetical protein [Candidatus Acidoferrum sp.]
MKEFAAFILPPATALAGMRMNRLLLGKEFETQFGAGFRFALGLAMGMFVFAQIVLFGGLAGFNAAGFLAWLAIMWGCVEIVLQALKLPAAWKSFTFQPGYFWLIFLVPLFYSWWVLGQLSTLEGTLEFDANVFWTLKAKILYLVQGKAFINTLHQTNLGYSHMDYPWLVPGIYALDYGVVGGVDEFVNKVWPFWMMVCLSIGVLSLGNVWKRPHPLPIAVVTVVGFLPATIDFMRKEGGTIPLVFYMSMLALLLVNAITRENRLALAIAIPIIGGSAMAKFEGLVFGAFWLCVLFPFYWKRGWLKEKLVWKSVVVTGILLLPYVWYRLIKPVDYPLSGWWHALIAAPGLVLLNYPKVLFMDVFGRFFNTDFFHWTLKDNIHPQWDGKWMGLSSLANEQMSILPWLLLVLLAFSFWKKRQPRVLLSLTLAILGMLAFLPFVITCLSYTQSDTPHAPDLTYAFPYYNNVEMGRYLYPFLTAWFLGIACVWFANDQVQSPKGEALKKAPVQKPAA